LAKNQQPGAEDDPYQVNDPLEDVNRGYEDLREGRNIRGVIVM